MITCFQIVILLVTMVTVKARVLTATERQDIYVKCYQQSGMDPEEVAKAIRESSLLDPTPAYLAQLTCIYKEQGYQDNVTGEIVSSEIKQFLANFYTEKECNFVVDSCLNTGGSTHGEIAYRAFECLLKNLKKVDEQRASTNKV